ncbi:thermonuclease family protein [Methylobacterium haplocladii]|nr:thermonuclease family protein [Methylobacterium haplocladii]
MGIPGTVTAAQTGAPTAGDDTMWRGTSAAVIGIVAAVIGAGSARAEPIVGRASVIDGDTIEIRGQRFRLQGVDTPESAQLCQDAGGKDYRCGQKASLALADKIGAGNVSCEPVTTDRYGRTVAICSLNALDLNGWLVEQGLGMAYRKYSTAYVGQEEAAKAARRGIWQGAFTPPWDWRKGERIGPEGQTVPPPVHTAGACDIKGNISRGGDRIYHLPGSRSYEKTVITESSGERMFCSEDEAKAAGWRPPRG